MPASGEEAEHRKVDELAPNHAASEACGPVCEVTVSLPPHTTMAGATLSCLPESPRTDEG